MSFLVSALGHKMLSSEELFSRTQCNCCQQDIPGIGLECVDCPNSVKLCCECFGLGAEIGQHKPEHTYRFSDSSGNIFLFPNGTNWTAKENIRLLDGIEQFGFGNWQDISKHIESKTPSESKEEYVRRFVDGSTGKFTWANCKGHERPTVDHTCPDDHTCPLSPSLNTSKLSPLRMGTEEASQLGYMNLRDDYEKEYDNDAEKLVSQLVFSADDEEIDIALKLALVDMYSKRLRERNRRKRIIRDYQMVSTFFKKNTTKTKRRFLPYERDVIEKLKSFQQFHTAREHEHLVQNLIRERELQFRIQELFKYRRNGITKQDDCVEFEKAGKSETNTTRLNGSRVNSAISIEPPPIETEVDRSHNNAENHLRADQFIVHLQGENESDCIYQDKNPILQLSSYGVANSNSMGLKSEERYSQITEKDVAPEDLLKPQGEQRALGDPFIANILNLKSSHLLSTKERNLCVNNNLQPTQYLTIKTALLLNQRSEKPSTISDSEWQEIINFMMTSGWACQSQSIN